MNAAVLPSPVSADKTLELLELLYEEVARCAAAIAFARESGSTTEIDKLIDQVDAFRELAALEVAKLHRFGNEAGAGAADDLLARIVEVADRVGATRPVTSQTELPAATTIMKSMLGRRCRPERPHRSWRSDLSAEAAGRSRDFEKVSNWAPRRRSSPLVIPPVGK